MPHQFTSFKSLQRTIETDRKVLRWFIYLITQPNVKKDILSLHDHTKLYQSLQKSLRLHQYIFFLLFLLFTSSYILKQYFILIPFFILLYLFIQIDNKSKSMVCKLSMALVSKEFDESSIREKTLFQIGEYFSKKYNINSIVFSLTSVNRILRTSVLYIAVLTAFIYPAKSAVLQWGILVASFILINGLINLTPLYKRLK